MNVSFSIIKPIKLFIFEIFKKFMTFILPRTFSPLPHFFNFISSLYLVPIIVKSMLPYFD